ncbi:predicted protein [Chaetomium globosum CBS 148.51]|uniref:Uncharacterized protein n=1 Tax=Chaetomium globosum (strain ATCC 6205 / CBS 148.51 / DSM 1962 / NBRC 6347 / NRRL 1970) TaxID=306901 RepID=Q2GVM1_CHAGB|nr:uncharacterized protein CHGG_07983 [Chaetomium globosum CBS 148.51]EAQ86730.1 predicted protein [Chaetomium globosum CBS 148.51]
MSSAASPVAGGGSATTKQSGTAIVVNDELVSYPARPVSQSNYELKEYASPAYTTPVDQGVGVEHVDNNNDDSCSDVDSLFGDISNMNEYFENALENESNGNGNSLPEDSDHTTSGSEQPIPVTHDFLTSPTTIDESTNAVTDPHEEFHDNDRVSNSAITVNQATIGNGDHHSGTIPTNSFNNNILFGPELQKALFNKRRGFG